MSYKGRERLAFWIEQVCGLSVAVLSVWYAARIGYTEAIRFNRYEELRKTRNMLRALEDEAAFNERECRQALSDCTLNQLNRTSIVAPSFQNVRESKSYLYFSPGAWCSISDAYEGILDADAKEDMLRLRMEGGSYAPALFRLKAEQLGKARTMLRKEVELVEARMRVFGSVEPSLPKPPRPVPPPILTEEETGIGRRPPSPGWGKGPPARYEGPIVLPEGPPPLSLNFGHLATPMRDRGPVIIDFLIEGIPADRRPARLWLYFSRTAPYDLEARFTLPQDEGTLRELLTRPSGAGAFVLNHPLDPDALGFVAGNPPKWSGQALDTNEIIGWNWVFAVAEDDVGTMRFLRFTSGPKVNRVQDKDPRLMRRDDFREVLSPHAIVLPLGYLNGPAVARTGPPDPRFVSDILACGLGKATESRSAADPRPLLRHAEADFTAAIGADPARAEAWHARGLVRTYLWNFEGALADLAKAGQLGHAPAAGAHRRALRFQEDREAAAELWRSTADPAGQSEQFFRKGQDALGRKDYAAAAAFLKNAFYLGPWRNPAIPYGVAGCYALVNDPDRALDWLEVAIEHGFDNWLHLLTDPDLAGLAGHSRWRALTDAKVAELGPRVREAQLRRKLKAEDAEFQNQAILSDAETRRISSQALEFLQAKEYAKAIEAYKTVFYRGWNANWVNASYNLACCYSLLGQSERALDWLELCVLIGWKNWAHLKQDSDLDSLRGDPRYKKLVEGR